MGGSVLAALSSVQRRNKQCQLFSSETTSETLSAFMSEYGKVVSCDTGVTRNGRTRGWAIVEMSSAAEAQAAIASGSGQDLEGRPLNIRLDQGKQEKSEKPKRAPRGDGERRGGDPSLEGKAENSSGLQVVVRNLPWSVTSEMLRGTFEQIGKVQNAEFIYHADSGRSKGWGTVRFSKAEEATDAIARFGGVELAGRPMTVMMDRFN